MARAAFLASAARIGKGDLPLYFSNGVFPVWWPKPEKPARVLTTGNKARNFNRGESPSASPLYFFTRIVPYAEADIGNSLPLKIRTFSANPLRGLVFLPETRLPGPANGNSGRFGSPGTGLRSGKIEGNKHYGSDCSPKISSVHSDLYIQSRTNRSACNIIAIRLMPRENARRKCSLLPILPKWAIPFPSHPWQSKLCPRGYFPPLIRVTQNPRHRL